VIFDASNFPCVAGFLNRRTSSSENECVIPFVGQDAEYEPRTGRVTSSLLVSHSHTCLSASNLSRENTKNSSALERDSPMMSTTNSSPNERTHHNQIQLTDNEGSSDLNESSPIEAENSVQPPVQHQMVTRSRAGIFKPKIPYIGVIEMEDQHSNLEPKTTKEVVSTSNNARRVLCSPTQQNMGFGTLRWHPEIG